MEDALYRVINGLSAASPTTLIVGTTTVTTTITSLGGGETEFFGTGIMEDMVRKSRLVYSEYTTSANFYYGAQVGEFGIEMSNNTEIRGQAGGAGNVYSNGAVLAGPNTAITGELRVASGIFDDQTASSTVCNQDVTVGQSNPQVDFAQSFRPSSTTLIHSIDFYIKKVGNPSSATVRIVNDNAVTGGIFYASESTVYLENNVTLTSVVGNGLTLDNNAYIEYDVAIEDLTFSTGPSGGSFISEWEEEE